MPIQYYSGRFVPNLWLFCYENRHLGSVMNNSATKHSGLANPPAMRIQTKAAVALHLAFLFVNLAYLMVLRVPSLLTRFEYFNSKAILVHQT